MSHSVGRICLFWPSLHLIDRRCQRARASVAVRRTKPKLRAGWEIGTPKSRKSRRTVLSEGWLAGDLRAYLSHPPPPRRPRAPLFPGRYGRNAMGIPAPSRSTRMSTTGLRRSSPEPPTRTTSSPHWPRSGCPPRPRRRPTAAPSEASDSTTSGTPSRC